MARVTALIGDLLFGSKAVSLLEAGGHAVTLQASAPGGQGTTPDLADIVVVDLTTGELPEVAGNGVPVLGVFAHIEPDVRERALAAGYDLVVPRSRFMREGAALVDQLLAKAT
jgi:hypothetical protein